MSNIETICCVCIHDLNLFCRSRDDRRGDDRGARFGGGGGDRGDRRGGDRERRDRSRDR